MIPLIPTHMVYIPTPQSNHAASSCFNTLVVIVSTTIFWANHKVVLSHSSPTNFKRLLYVLGKQAIAFLKRSHFSASHSKKINFLKIDTTAVVAAFEIENVRCQTISGDIKNFRSGAKTFKLSKLSEGLSTSLSSSE